MYQEKNATWSPNSVPPNPESLVPKRFHARSPDEEDDSPTNKKMKLNKQAYDHVLHAFNAESPALSHVNLPLLKSFFNSNDSDVCCVCVCSLMSLSSFSQGL